MARDQGREAHIHSFSNTKTEGIGLAFADPLLGHPACELGLCQLPDLALDLMGLAPAPRAQAAAWPGLSGPGHLARELPILARNLPGSGFPDWSGTKAAKPRFTISATRTLKELILLQVAPYCPGCPGPSRPGQQDP